MKTAAMQPGRKKKGGRPLDRQKREKKAAVISAGSERKTLSSGKEKGIKSSPGKRERGHNAAGTKKKNLPVRIQESKSSKRRRMELAVPNLAE